MTKRPSQPEPEYAAILRALAAELLEVAALPPRRAMMALAKYVDRKGEDGAERRITLARRAAAADAVAEADSQSALARELGVSTNLVSRLVRAER